MTTVQTKKQKDDQVKGVHDDHKQHAAKWVLVDDLLDGNTTKYLRDVGALEKPDKNGSHEKGTKRQKDYEEGVYLLNFTSSTLAKMVGGVFRNEPTHNLKGKMDYQLSNSDGNHNSIHQSAQRALSFVLSHGHCGLFVDAPIKKKNDSSANDKDGSKDPKIIIYPASAITNWSTDDRQLVVLKEVHTYRNNENEFKDFSGNQYRVLDIKDNIYRMRIFKFDDSGDLMGDVIEFNPTANGKKMTRIPFSFIGANDNTAKIDPAPMFPIADLNRVLYRNTADNEEQLFVLSQAMLVVSPDKSMKAADWHELNPDGVSFGAKSGLIVPGGSANIIQAAANNALSNAIKEKIEQAVAVGAEIITPTKVVTAESARLQKGGEVSMLTNASNNVSTAFEFGLEICAEYKADSTVYEYELNTEFFMTLLTAADRTAWLNDISAGITTKDNYRDRLRASGEIKSEVTNSQLERDAETTLIP